MLYVWATLLTLLNAGWLVTVVLGLPGTWLMVISTALVAWWQWDRVMIGLPTLVVIAVLALLGEIAEFIAGVWGTKQFGGTNWGAGGALVGTLIGGLVGTFAIPVPVLGSLIGACAGAALGAWGFELSAGQKMKPSLKSAAGAGIGRLSGTVAKLAAGVLIWVIAAVAAFWP
ncbi:MAG: DUF456 domain-containing protein [Phycisphaerae bacterium]|nr:DUF456 domain-containing protein [Phycisphaerae bacterium]